MVISKGILHSLFVRKDFLGCQHFVSDMALLFPGLICHCLLVFDLFFCFFFLVFHLVQLYKMVFHLAPNFILLRLDSVTVGKWEVVDLFIYFLVLELQLFHNIFRHNAIILGYKFKFLQYFVVLFILLIYPTPLPEVSQHFPILHNFFNLLIDILLVSFGHLICNKLDVFTLWLLGELKSFGYGILGSC